MYPNSITMEQKPFTETSKVFESYGEKRVANFDTFYSSKKEKETARESTIRSQWERAPLEQKKALNDAMINIFKEAPATATMRRDNAAVYGNTYNQLVEGKEQNILGVLEVMKQDELEVIKAQHQAETTKAEALFAKLDEPVFEMFDATTAENFKKDFLSKLVDKQKTELDEFNQEHKKNKDIVGEKLLREQRRLALLGNVFNNPNQNLMKEDIERRMKPVEEGPTVVSTDPLHMRLSLKGIELTDLDVVQTVTGKRLEKDANGNFVLQYGYFEYLWNSLFNINTDDDIINLIKLKQLSSKDNTIEIDVDGGDQEEAMEFARRVYRLCVDQGYSASEIKINVNGTLATTTYDKDGKKSQDGVLFKDMRIPADRPKEDPSQRQIAMISKKFTEEVKNIRKEEAQKVENRPGADQPIIAGSNSNRMGR